MSTQTQTEKLLAAMDPKAAVSIIAAAADLSLLVDQKGIIREAQLSNDQLPLGDLSTWIGKPWTDMVTSESRIKVEELTAEAQSKSLGRWRHLNFPSAQGADVPVLFAAAGVGTKGDTLAYGRDLRNLASLQQRLVEAHQAMERDYLRMRHMETRYRLLFELASEAVLIVDPNNYRVLEANPAASKILNLPVKKIIGKSILESVTDTERSVIEDLLATVKSSGDADVRTISGGKDAAQITVSASIFRQETGNLFLVRLTPPELQQHDPNAPRRSVILDVLEHSPDGFIVTDTAGKILTCNHAFIEMAQLTKAEQVVGRNLSDWLGRSDVDLSVLVANIQQRGAVRLFSTMLHGANGSHLQVEISGVSVKSAPTPCLGFSIRDVGQRMGIERPSLHELPRSADQLVELVGRVPLQEIVSETADLIEKLCIEAALRLTRDNRASASEMLGLSRQSLYVKLRRYGIGEVTDRSKK